MGETLSRSLALTLQTPGTVYLVGARPGDPDLLTSKRSDCCGSAMLWFPTPWCLSSCWISPPSRCAPATWWEAKRPLIGAPTRSTTCCWNWQHDAVAWCPPQRGRPVPVRPWWRGGDPPGTGHGIPLEVVPRVTAGIAAPAYAGIPVTHRRAGSSVTFVTGRAEIDKSRPGVDWAGLGRCSDGLVIYMELQNLESSFWVAGGGLQPRHPAAVIQQGIPQGKRHLVSALEQLGRSDPGRGGLHFTGHRGDRRGGCPARGGCCSIPCPGDHADSLLNAGQQAVATPAQSSWSTPRVPSRRC